MGLSFYLRRPVMKKLICSVVLMIMLSSVVLAETIHLKSGKKIKGKILEKTDEYIRADIYGVSVTFYLEDIERIDEVKPEEAKETKEVKEVKEETKPDIPSSYIIEDNLYVSESFGFTVLTPKWMEIGRNPRQVEFSKEKQIKKGVFSTKLLISIDKSSNFPNVRSAISYADAVVNDVKARWRERVEIIESVKKADVDNYDVATLTYKLIGEDDIGNRGVVIAHYFYYLGDDVVVLMFADGDKTFQSNYSYMTKYLKSFKLLAAQDNLTYLMDLNKKEAKFTPLETEAYAGLKKDILDNMNIKKSYKAHLLIKDKLDERLSKFKYKGLEIGMTFLDEKNFEITHWNYYAGGVGDIWRVSGDDMYIKIGFWMPMPTAIKSPEGEEQKGFEEMTKRRKEIYKDLSYRRYLKLLEKESPASISNDIDDFIVLKFIPTDLGFIPFIDQEITVFKKEVLLWISKNDNTLRFAKTTIQGSDKDKKGFLKKYEHYFNNFDLPYTLGEPAHIYQKD